MLENREQSRVVVPYNGECGRYLEGFGWEEFKRYVRDTNVRSDTLKGQKVGRGINQQINPDNYLIQ